MNRKEMIPDMAEKGIVSVIIAIFAALGAVAKAIEAADNMH